MGTKEELSIEELGAEVSSSALTPLRFLERSARVWTDRPAVVDGKQIVDLRRARRARAPRGGRRARRARDRRGRPRRGAAPQRPLDARAALRRPRRPRRAGAAQHPPRPPGVRLHPRALRREGARRRPRASRTSWATTPRAAVARRLRGARRGHRPGRGARAPRGRAHADLDQLHLGHHRQAQGRDDQPPRRLPARAGRHRRGSPHAAQLLPVDAAHVPLQRLGLSVGGHRHGRQARLPPEGGGEADLERAHQGGHHAPVRRADRADHDRRRRRGREARRARPGVRGRRAAVAGAAGQGRQAQPPDHPPVRADRDLRPARGLRLEPRLGRARRRRAAEAARPPGRRHRRLRAPARGRRGHE